jgi:hypothetical protein
MVYKAQYPTLPKLYKVLSNGKSCNGGSYTWDTAGGLNVLGGSHAGKPLSHCNVGFHLTTDWRNWYSLGRDVYTAIPGDRQVLVKHSWSGECEDKVVVGSVYLSDKNADPLAKLLKHFHTDFQWVIKNFDRTQRQRGNMPKHCRLTRQTNVDRIGRFQHSFVTPGESMRNDHRHAFAESVRYILSKLVQSVDDKISMGEKNHVYNVWTLWQNGWAVYGYDEETEKYLVK